MRVISFVPSWTETLIEAGVEVVGRTRFCLHPAEAVRAIPVVGGTKQANWDRVRELEPDLILFDREENTQEMAKACPFPYHATHVTSMQSMADDLERLGDLFHNSLLKDFATHARSLASASTRSWLDGVKYLVPPRGPIETVLYMIWRQPWMAVSRNTFIGDVCHHAGMELPVFDSRYPEIDLNNYSPETTLLLFSSEPYPFHRFEQELMQFGFPCAIVDGESFSWFGIRSIRFMETLR